MSGISFNRTTVLTIVLIVEVLVVLFFVARWYSRKWGWRSTFRRVRAYVRGTLADLAAPVVQLYRFGRNVRAIAAQLEDPELGGVLHSATASAGAELAVEPDARSYAATLSQRGVSLAIAGPARPLPPAPWSERQGWWSVPRTAIAPSPADAMDPGLAGHLVIGAQRGDVTLIDLERAPGVVEIAGPPRPVYSLLCGVAAQLSSRLTGNSGVEVIVTAGVHPLFRGQKLRTVLEALYERAAQPPAGHQIVLVCGHLSPHDADMITALTPAMPSLRVVTAGPYPGRRWKLPVTAAGRVEAPELGLSTDSAPLERGIARALKRRAANPQRPTVTLVPPSGPAGPGSPGTGTTVPQPTATYPGTRPVPPPASTRAGTAAASAGGPAPVPQFDWSPPSFPDLAPRQEPAGAGAPAGSSAPAGNGAPAGLATGDSESGSRGTGSGGPGFGNTGFGRPGFGESGFRDTGFANSDFGASAFKSSAFNTSGDSSPGSTKPVGPANPVGSTNPVDSTNPGGPANPADPKRPQKPQGTTGSAHSAGPGESASARPGPPADPGVMAQPETSSFFTSPEDPEPPTNQGRRTPWSGGAGEDTPVPGTAPMGERRRRRQAQQQSSSYTAPAPTSTWDLDEPDPEIGGFAAQSASAVPRDEQRPPARD
ncbi:hypothetical protein KIH74_25405 [Kineosporia sp. J2-2]|uniref:Uncharacterized protein n=1 Tax=Kineosporia corallincola TaxID=2835133 RepID=A0ABS5TMH7_9ACTN|nr:hypothetical protein [Kineosporia corallincola]MBT0772307.1 hypothetical protein [Kineosporia corallincola]